MRAHPTMLAARTLVAAMLLTAVPAASEAPELSREQMEQFLQQAEIIDIEALSKGVTESRRATLRDGELTHRAHVQTVDIFMKKFTGKGVTEFNFRDCYRYNIAAYRLDKLLDLGMVPVTVQRVVAGEEAAVTWWVPGVMMDGFEYRANDRKPPDMALWNAQKFQGWAFQQLVYNTDPNLGNFVVDEDWKIWMLDYTRAFRQWKKLNTTEGMRKVGRGLLERLRQLDPDDIRRELGPVLDRAELNGVIARREILVAHYDRLIAEQGESEVLITRPGF